MDVCTLLQIIEQPVNIFNGVLDKDCSHIVKMKAVLDGIELGNWEDQIDRYREETDKKKRENLKRNLPGVTFSGVFNEQRLDKNLARYNNVMVVDIDMKDMAMPFQKTWDCVINTPFIFCAFRSPSGGIKALAYSDMKAEDHKIFFRGVEEYMGVEYGIIIDTSGKNPGRLCFISYDPNMYLSHTGLRGFELETDAPETYVYEKSREFEQVHSLDYSQYENSYDVKFIMDVAKSRAEKGVGAYHRGNRNNFIFYLGCIFNRAGIQKEMAIDIIFGHYPSLGQEEVARTLRSAYQHSDEFGSRPIMKKKTDQNTLL